jgi:SAM-dependent methyltransferase
MSTKAYNDSFFAEMHTVSAQTASIVVPMLLENLSPQSVLDVGCGTGAWLNEFWRRGVRDVRGVEGNWAPTEFLDFPPSLVERANATSGFNLGRRFELVISVEVAEHLEQASSRRFVEDLTRHGDVVYFTAAIPGQGGTNHLNEQWPDYWASLFAEEGFRMIDWPRQTLWADLKVDPCVIQNGFLYAREKVSLLEAIEPANSWPLRMVHPRLFSHTVGKLKDPEVYKACLTARKVLCILPSLLRRSITERLRR